MASFATKLAEAFAKETIKIYYQSSVIDDIANRNYEGEIKGVGSLLNVLTFSKISMKNYTGSALTADTLTESNSQLNINQQKAYYFKIQSLAKFQSYIKNPESTILEQVGHELKEVVDNYGLSLYGKTAAGNRIGTDYVTGTVTVTTGTGAVVGVGTTFTAAMVGRGFKATGHTSWYRVKTFTNATNIVIEDDLDDVASQYTGGTITGATYTIEAATPVAITSSNVYGSLANLKQKLDAQKIPLSDRNIVIPSKVAAMMLQSTQLVTPVDASYENIVTKGIIGMVLGMKIYQSEQVAGDNVNGYHCIAAHKSWLTFAEAFTETGIEPLLGDFGQAYKGLFLYGAKVIDERRKAGAEWFVTA